ncbi:hypothetical protein GCM10011514_43000 [Emticicia aquatilis]|uniref:Bulb-type lectin domain-containing protein n=1 Tax=Emticicia aquatilis TaxID=1537369 RepID=A0A917DWH2_9BACT|nr:hypothetical protein [Emticicia aquatilis]GGD74327.1 hypothetical protein GCM10011514_43000 [Emticicia aquatilis]
MKNLLIFLLGFVKICFGQAAQTTPSGTLIANQNPAVAMPSSSLFEVRSNTKGMLPPRMTTNRINAIVSPTIGLMAYDIDVKCLKIYNGSEWECSNANVVASTPVSSSFAFQSITDNVVNPESITADNSGNTITVGYFNSAITFGNANNVMTLTSLGNADGYISKHDQNGNLIWATQIGGSANNQDIRDVEIDNLGNIVVVGYLIGGTTFFSTNGSTAVYNAPVTSAKAFVAYYNSSGILQWYKLVDSSGDSDCLGVTFDSLGNILFTGYFTGTASFDNISKVSVGSSNDIFVAKLNTTGTYQWVKTAGGTDNGEYGVKLTCDNSNNVYVYGSYTGTASFGENSSIINLTSRGSSDSFISKFDANGNIQWVKTLGSTFEEGLGDIVYSSATNNIFLSGSYKGTLTFGTGLGTNSLLPIGNYINYFDGFLAKYDLNGNVLWAVRNGCVNDFHNYTNGVSVDSNGNPYITGTIQRDTYFYSTNSNSPYLIQGVHEGEPFIAKYNSTGNLLWTILATDGYYDSCVSIAVKNNTANVVGKFSQTINFGFQQLRVVVENQYHMFTWRYAE